MTITSHQEEPLLVTTTWEKAKQKLFIEITEGRLSDDTPPLLVTYGMTTMMVVFTRHAKARTLPTTFMNFRKELTNGRRKQKVTNWQQSRTYQSFLLI
jgi:hypothetical protein